MPESFKMLQVLSVDKYSYAVQFLASATQKALHAASLVTAPFAVTCEGVASEAKTHFPLFSVYVGSTHAPSLLMSLFAAQVGSPQVIL